MSIATASDLETAPPRPLVTPLVLATGCTALADWLFYGWQPGISLALFLAVLGCIGISSNRVNATRKTRIIMTAAFAAGLLAIAEDTNFLSVVTGTLSTAMFVIVMTGRDKTSWQRQLVEALTIPFRGPFQFVGDSIGALRHMKIWTPGWLGWIVAWIVPLSVFAVFLTLFSSANPLIEHRLMQIDLRRLFELMDPWRLAFWVFIISMIWPLIRRRIKFRPTLQSRQGPVAAAESSNLDYLLGTQAVTRSLILFNALFALQTILDLTYLWGGAALPDGMSHAEYAHRGAYPLIATALLAAGFVLVAMRAGGPAENSRLIRPLVLIFIAQNILLVFSSIFRLDLYVAQYSLTYWRLAAFIWMGLVAIGLLLILIQIIQRKPNSWLLTANAISLALVLYGCCFLNAPWLVATYNVEHSREVTGTGQTLDWRYVRCLGPQALPAIERRREELRASWRPELHCCKNTRDAFVSSKNWRDWSFRAWRLQQFFANNPISTPVVVR